mgnify:CR=1 FL=1
MPAIIAFHYSKAQVVFHQKVFAATTSACHSLTNGSGFRIIRSVPSEHPNRKCLPHTMSTGIKLRVVGPSTVNVA